MKVIELAPTIASLQNMLSASKLYSKFIKPVLVLVKDLQEQQKTFEEAHDLLVKKITEVYGKPIPQTNWANIRKELPDADKVLVDEILLLKTSDVLITSKLPFNESYLDTLLETGKCDGMDIARTLDFFELLTEAPPKEADKE